MRSTGSPGNPGLQREVNADALGLQAINGSTEPPGHSEQSGALGPQGNARPPGPAAHFELTHRMKKSTADKVATLLQ